MPQEYKHVKFEETNADLVLKQNKRTTQQDIRSSAVQPHTLGVISQTTGVNTTSVSLAPGFEVRFQTITHSSSQRPIISGRFMLDIHIGSVASANKLPGGSGINENEWVWDIWYPDTYLLDEADSVPAVSADERVKNSHLAIVAYVLNNSSSTFTVHFTWHDIYVVEQGGGVANSEN